MIALNLETTTPEQKILKDYLEQNVSEILAEKINNGTSFEKDGKTLKNKKNLDGFLSYASDEARKLAEKGARSACIEDKTVFGWAIHYFEEASIEGKLYNEDGTEYKPIKPKSSPKIATPSAYTPPKPKPNPQASLFDLFDMTPDKPKETEIQPQKIEAEPEPIIDAPKPVVESNDEDDIPSDEELQEIYRELAEYEQQAKSEEAVDLDTGEILMETEMRKFDGDIHEPKDVPDEPDNELTKEFELAKAYNSETLIKLSDILGDIFILR